jgi:hypothetical protein
VNNLFDGSETNFDIVQNYDFKLFDDFKSFRDSILKKDKEI